MKELTKKIYEEFHRQKFFHRKGYYPKRIKNFDKLKEKYPESWKNAELFSEMVERNAGKIDYSIFIEALVNNLGQSASTSDLPTRKAIKIYKNYIKDMDRKAGEKEIYQKFLDSVRFVTDYCAERDMDFNDYLDKGSYGLPQLLKHYNAGSISLYFIAMIPSIWYDLESYPSDAIDFLVDRNKFDDDFYLALSRIQNDDSFKKWERDFYNKINRVIEKKKKELGNND